MTARLRCGCIVRLPDTWRQPTAPCPAHGDRQDILDATPDPAA